MCQTDAPQIRTLFGVQPAEGHNAYPARAVADCEGPDPSNPNDWHVTPQGGLLSEVIGVYLHEAPDSSYRFWLSSVLEAFVRGNGLHEQLYVASSGVLDNILDRVLAEAHVDQEIGRAHV